VGCEVEGWVDGDRFVSEFLARYKEHANTWFGYGSVLFMFFKWLRVKKGLTVSGEESHEGRFVETKHE
jgi:hypothetical protein